MNTSPDFINANNELAQLTNQIYDLINDPTSFDQFANGLIKFGDDSSFLSQIGIALENSAKLSDRISDGPGVELSRDIGVLVVGIGSDNRVSHVPAFAESWLNAKFVGDNEGIGWVETLNSGRNIAHVLKFDSLKFLPVDSNLRDGVRVGKITRLLLVHQFSMSSSALQALSNLFSISGAELQLCKSIAQGDSIKEASEKADVKVSTSRSHLKSIFSKIGVRSQSELVRVLTQISAAAAIQEFSRKNKISLEPDWKNGLVSIQTQFAKTRYGTRVAFSKFGDPAGTPTLFFHGGLGSRFHTREMAVAAKRQGSLIYIFDRPGVGDSDALANLSLKALGCVVQDLLDHVGHDKIRAIGYGIGARTLIDILPYTDMRIEDVTVYSFRGGGQQKGFSIMNRLNQLAFENPSMARSFFRIMRLNASDVSMRKNMRKYYEGSVADTAALKSTSFVDEILRGNELSTRMGLIGYMFDLSNLAAPFPDFADPAFDIPIHAIFGDDDPFNCYDDNKEYLDLLPRRQVSLSPGCGQLHILQDFEGFLISAYSG